MLSPDPQLNEWLQNHVSDFAARWTETDGCRMHWLIGGSGPSLILLHGDYGSWIHWTRDLASLGQRYRLLVVDLPGYGNSAVLQGDFSKLRLAYSLSSVAGHLAAQQGDRVSHLVVCGPGGLGAPRASTRPGACFFKTCPDS